MHKDSRGDDDVVLGAARMPWMRGWLPVGFGTLLLLTAAAAILGAEDRDRMHQFMWVLWLIQGSVFLSMGISTRRARLELRADELVAVYPLRTVRIPYTVITDVHGDAPNHITWSTLLIVETPARSYRLPQAGADLALARDLILERVPELDPIGIIRQPRDYRGRGQKETMMSEQPSHDEVAHLEFDETIPPRPEEEIADAARSERAEVKRG